MFVRIAVFYVLTWFFLILLGGSQQATGLIPPEIGLAQWGPGIAALLMLLIFRKDGHRFVFFSRETLLPRYLTAVLIPAGAAVVVFLLLQVFPITGTNTPSLYQSLPLVLLWMPLGALGEEIGWRGYLHKKLNTRLRGIVSSLLVGLLWMPIHVHFLTQGPIFILFLFLLIASYSIVLYALTQDTGFNILLATIFHIAINLTNLLFLDVIYAPQFMMLNATVWLVIAALTVIFKRDAFLTPRA
jgi:membrane protease YdiL (CAAX protease family)